MKYHLRLRFIFFPLRRTPKKRLFFETYLPLLFPLFLFYPAGRFVPDSEQVIFSGLSHFVSPPLWKTSASAGIR